MVAFNPLQQVFNLTGPDGVTPVPVPVPVVDRITRTYVSTSINYGSQIGACLTMLLVALFMTPKARFARKTTMIHISALAVCTVRTILMVLYFNSSYTEFYTFYTNDDAFINPSDTAISVAATFLAVPMLILIETALIIQAWSMVQLWPSVVKWPTIALSGLLAFLAVAFKCAHTAFTIKSIIDTVSFDPSSRWVRRCDLVFGATTIFWFCFIFNIRLVMHMRERRSILPSIGGMDVMDVLVTTNGILMFVPVIFAILNFANIPNFEPGSLTNTSVVIILPLGTMVAQRIASTPSQHAHGNYRKTHTSADDGKTLWSDVSGMSGRRDSGNGHAGGAGISSRIQGGGSMHKRPSDPYEMELNNIDRDDLEKGGVRVEHTIEQHRTEAG